MCVCMCVCVGGGGGWRVVNEVSDWTERRGVWQLFQVSWLDHVVLDPGHTNTVFASAAAN